MSKREQIPIKRAGGRLSRQEAEELTARIIDTAIERFGEQGFAATTIEEIAALCSTTPRSVIRRFRSKDQLLVATVPRFGERLNRFRPRSPDGQEAMAALRQLMRFFVDMALRPDLRSFHLACVNEARRIPGLADALAESELHWEEELRDCFTRAQAEGYFTRYQASALATLAIAAALSYPFVLSEMGHPRFSAAEDADKFFEEIYTTLLGLQ
jgi:AcrR family transcriptional regulator